MSKYEFIDKLRSKLSGLPKQDLEERLSFYSEMIDDLMEEGMSEDDAVSKIGNVDEIASQILADIPLTKIAKEKIKSKRILKTWEIVLLVLGSPIWLSLAIAAFAVILSLYVIIWSVIISVWAVFVSVVACSLGGIISGGILAFSNNFLVGIALIGASIFCAGISIFLFFACQIITKSTVLLTKKIALSIKKCFIGKEEA